MIGGPVADRYGRKSTIILADFFFIIGALVMGLAPTIGVLILGRVLIGVYSIFLSYSLVLALQPWSSQSIYQKPRQLRSEGH